MRIHIIVKVLLALDYAYFTFSRNYSIEKFRKICKSQTQFVLDAWKVEHAWVNPSMALSPTEPNKAIYSLSLYTNSAIKIF